MKKISTLLIALAAIFAVQAQEATYKVANSILPEEGDFAIGVDASPFLEYIGGIFSDAGATAPEFGSTTFYGKYFLSPESAVRASLKLNLGPVTTSKLPGYETDNTEKVEIDYIDVEKRGTTEFELAVGYELRRGYDKLQGFYGAQVLGGFLKTSNTAQSGKDISKTHLYNHSWGVGNYHSTNNSYHLGVGGFAGVEYFITSKISIAGELSLNIIYNKKMKGITHREYYDAVKDEVKETDSETLTAGDSFKFTTQPGAGLSLLFHF